jgi:CubicO group peptidase (beta-lactamase class C family)
LDAARPGVAPAIGAVVTRAGHPIYSYGADRVFDLASLTKVLCTTEVAMRAVASGALSLDAPHPLLPPGVHVRHLLQHASGYPAWRALWGEGSRDAVVAAAVATPRSAPPGVSHVYSDIGFLALGALLEQVGGARIDALYRGSLRWGDPTAEPTFCFERSAELRGQVHDRNAAAMGGVAPHAGLFGSAREVVASAQAWLDGRVPGAALAFTSRGPGTHALGWDTPSPGGGSSAGPRPPADAVGHLGFTGTALWMSPSMGVIAVLLTNRVMCGPDLTGIRTLRPAWFQAVWDGLAAGAGDAAGQPQAVASPPGAPQVR